MIVDELKHRLATVQGEVQHQLDRAESHINADLDDLDHQAHYEAVMHAEYLRGRYDTIANILTLITALERTQP